MARRYDSGWRDPSSTQWHKDHGFEAPAAGMTLPMIEYDHGVPVGLVSYHRRDVDLPVSPDVGDAHRAFGRLCGRDGLLPFLTAVYDPNGWAFKVLGHNESGAALTAPYGSGWVEVTETEFAQMLYRMRGRRLPDLVPHGVRWGVGMWQADARPMHKLPWPGSDMSCRRRSYEPVIPVAMKHRIPCVDIDFAVISRDPAVALVVDYKAGMARVNPDSTNMRALSSLAHGEQAVPAMVAKYFPGQGGWSFKVMCLNTQAHGLLKYVVPEAGRVTASEQVILNETRWLDVLRAARDL